MKKIITTLSMFIMSIILCFSFVGCSSSTYIAIKLTDAEPESYGFAVKKGANANILTAVNEVIASEGFEAKVDELVKYYTALYGDETPDKLSFELPDLSDNTAGTLTVGTEAGFAPFEFVASNEVVGLDIAIMQMIAEELNYKIEVKDMNFDSLPAALKSGDIDIIAAGFTNNPERAVEMDFSSNYFTSQQFVVCEEGKNYDKLENLKDLKIGVQMGTTGDFLVSDAKKAGDLGSAEVVQYKSITLAMQALKKGEINAIVIDELPAKSLLKANN